MNSEMSERLMEDLRYCQQKVGRLDDTYDKPMGVLVGIHLGDDPRDVLADPVAGKYVTDLIGHKYLREASGKIEVTTLGEQAVHLYFNQLKTFSTLEARPTI